MKFICDEMLKGLARWLRAAGYDTELANEGESDRLLIDRARSSGRLLLTRDKKLMEFRNAIEIVRLLQCSGIDDCAITLNPSYRSTGCTGHFHGVYSAIHYSLVSI